MKPKILLQALGIVAVVALGIVTAFADLPMRMAVLFVMAILAIAVPEVLEDMEWGPFGGP